MYDLIVRKCLNQVIKQNWYLTKSKYIFDLNGIENNRTHRLNNPENIACLLDEY